MHWGFTVGRLVESLHNPQELKGDNFVFHVAHVGSMGYTLMATFYLFWSKPRELIIIFNGFYPSSNDINAEESGMELKEIGGKIPNDLRNVITFAGT